jgi:hypothetical protein
MSPRLAQDVTLALVDALWAHFYATGSAAAVLRVLDVATLFLEFLDDGGERLLVPAASGELPPVPADVAEDPLALMRFVPSRHALASLLRHTATHVSVGDIALAQLEELEARVTLVDPAGDGEALLTAFGAKRLRLLRRMRSTLAQLARHAVAEGVGSGRWPEGMRVLFGEDEGAERPAPAPALALEGGGAAGQHHGAPGVRDAADAAADAAASAAAAHSAVTATADARPVRERARR